jgi:multidrug efflux pump subunit AcrB
MEATHVSAIRCLAFLVGVAAGNQDQALTAEPLPNVARQEVTFQLRQYPENQQPWFLSGVVWVRLDVDRLHAHDITSEDVMKALTVGCSFAGANRRVEPPPDVVFVTHLDSPDRYEKFILKATPEGEVVRLKDVARVEAGWSFFDLARWMMVWIR